MRFLVLPQHELAKFCLKPVSETQYISSSCTLCCMLSKLYASFTIKCIKNVLCSTNRKFIYFSKLFHAVLYIALENHVPLPRFPETFSMWYRIVFGTKLHRFHYCCNLWWVQPLYCINTLDYNLNQYWHIVNCIPRNIFQRHFIRNQTILSKIIWNCRMQNVNDFVQASMSWHVICLGLCNQIHPYCRLADRFLVHPVLLL